MEKKRRRRETRGVVMRTGVEQGLCNTRRWGRGVNGEGCTRHAGEGAHSSMYNELA